MNRSIRIIFLIVLPILLIGIPWLISENVSGRIDGMLDQKARFQASRYAGNWINAAYVEALQKSQSPRASQEVANPSFIQIPDQLGKNGLRIDDFHDGTPFLWLDGLDGLGRYDIDDSTSLLEGMRIGPRSMRLEGEEHEYLRMGSEAHILAEFLFAGQYLIEDDTIRFHPNGMIYNWPDFDQYQGVIDYIGPAMDVDQIILGKENMRLVLGFKFQADQLVLYELRCIEGEKDDCQKVAFDMEFARLRRLGD
ncbi:MAG: hypothetical protein AAF206_03510 [Bacteroidota bacterium]